MTAAAAAADAKCVWKTKPGRHIRSGGQQLTSGFSGANIGMASVQLGGERYKSWDNAYLNIVDTLPHVTNCEKDNRTIIKIIGSV